MPRPPLEDRIASYMSRLPAAVSGSGGHTATFKAAVALVHGWGLEENEAWGYLVDFNSRCTPPWSEAELRHKLRSARASNPQPPDWAKVPRAWLREDRDNWGQTPPMARPALPPQKPRTVVDPEILRRAAGELSGKITLQWLANRSAIEPVLLSAAQFLGQLYDARHERVLIFTQQASQGQALWPDDRVPVRGPEGVWFLAQPVDGAYHPNPRSLGDDGQPKMSRRSQESVRAFRYLVLESDEVAAADWLAVLARLPLQIDAIYTSGKRSVHALVRIDQPTHGAWLEEVRRMEPVLKLLGMAGADTAAMTPVRLTRLPQCLRGTNLQRLLYLRPKSAPRALADMLAVRDAVPAWLELARIGISDADEANGAQLKRALRWYAGESEPCAAALEKLTADEPTR